SPVKPLEEEAGQAKYGRDCMRNQGHEDGSIPPAEINARRLDAVVYREYLDSAYLIPKPDKLIQADINEPLYENRVPGTGIYARPCQRLKIHVWNDDDVPHSLHAHGLSYGIDSDGTWPFGTQASNQGGRSDAICPGDTWVYTFDVTYDMYGPWPFHDYTHYSNQKIEQGLFGGIVVLTYCEKPPKPFRFRKGLLAGIYADLQKREGRNFFPDDRIDFDETRAPFILLPQIHVKRFKEETLQILEHYLDFLEEDVSREFSQQVGHVQTDHVPVFFHQMVGRPDPPPPPRPDPLPAPPLDLDLVAVVARQRQLLDLAVGLPVRPDLVLNPNLGPLVPVGPIRPVRPIPSLCRL